MGAFRRQSSPLPDLADNEFSSRFNNTGGAYAIPHCDPLRMVLGGGMGSIGDNLLVEERMRARLAAAGTWRTCWSGSLLWSPRIPTQ